MYISWDAPVPDVTSITAVRDYVLDLHNKIIQVGLVQTSHPNQFDFVNEPDQPNDTSTGITKTYKPLIYRFNDNLVQTYIKITFGKCNSGSSALNRQRMFSIVEIGISINPDGTFTNLPVCRYFNSAGAIGSSTTYTSKNGNSHISKFDNGSAFTLLATPGYSYTGSSANSLALCLISLERTSTDVVINTYIANTVTSFSISTGITILQSQYVLSKYSYDNPIYLTSSLVKLMTLASNLYPLINYRSGGNITKSKVVYYYSQVSPLPVTAMLPFVENGKTILPIGNFMNQYYPIATGNYFIAYCMEDINEV